MAASQRVPHLSPLQSRRRGATTKNLDGGRTASSEEPGEHQHIEAG